MKKLVYIAALALAMGSCGKSSKTEAEAAADSVPEAVDSVPVADAVTYYMVKDSVGTLSVGTPVKSLPDSIPGLYSSKENGASPDAVTVVFSDSDGEQFVGYDFGEGNIDVINLIGEKIKVKAPRGDFGLGDPFARVLELPGVTAEWTGYDDGGMWYWKWEGLWFAPSQENLTGDLSRRLYHSGQAPTYKDFPDNITIGFIGTGLPF